MIIERTYNIPLRKEWLKSPKYKRAKKAIIAVKEFLSKHMHQEELDKIKLGEHINLEIWSNGIKNPPHHIKVNVKKLEDGTVYTELFGYKIKLPEEEKEKKAKSIKKKEEEKKKEASEDKEKSSEKESGAKEKNREEKIEKEKTGKNKDEERENKSEEGKKGVEEEKENGEASEKGETKDNKIQEEKTETQKEEVREKAEKKD